MRPRIFLSRRSVLSRRSKVEEDGEGGCSMRITEDVRKFAAEQKLSEAEALKAGMEQKAREFTETGAEIYSKI